MMSDRVRAALSVAIGFACLAVAVSGPFNASAVLGLLIGFGNLAAAVLLLRQPAQ